MFEYMMHQTAVASGDYNDQHDKIPAQIYQCCKKNGQKQHPSDIPECDHSRLIKDGSDSIFKTRMIGDDGQLPHERKNETDKNGIVEYSHNISLIYRHPGQSQIKYKKGIQKEADKPYHGRLFEIFGKCFFKCGKQIPFVVYHTLMYCIIQGG